MTISICMGTYNGEKYIEEQLLCLLRQTVIPDEVIICDDCSTDNTTSIIQDFIERNRLQDTWKLYVNKENKGYPLNFYDAMSLCTKEFVFLADQDDIWHPQKLEKLRSIFARKKEAQVVACKFGLIDEKGQNIHTVMTPTHNTATGNLRQVNIHDVFYKYEWPGMVMAYRREWYQDWSQNNYAIPHDLLISAKAAEEGVFFQLDEELAWHRRHDSNAAKEEHRIGKLLNKKRKLQEIEIYTKYLDEFSKRHILQTIEGKRVFEKKRRAMSDRYNALRSGKMGDVIKSAKDNKESVRLATLVCDVIICRQKE